MPRRASAKHHPTIWIFVVGLIIILGAGGYYLYRNVNDPFRTLQPLDVSIYLENSNSLRGNTYKIQATIQNSLAWSPNLGRLFSVAMESGEPLPLLVPVQFNQTNLQKGQKFFFKIKISEKGILTVEDLKKS
ncbi:MAG: hypothetical protein K1X66_09650 [Verrucomicrobiae bacterium]|nr:hypothetical protein [Verrucomicrobiae bacterium]